MQQNVPMQGMQGMPIQGMQGMQGMGMQALQNKFLPIQPNNSQQQILAQQKGKRTCGNIDCGCRITRI